MIFGFDILDMDIYLHESIVYNRVMKLAILAYYYFRQTITLTILCMYGPSNHISKNYQRQFNTSRNVKNSFETYTKSETSSGQVMCS